MVILAPWIKAARAEDRNTFGEKTERSGPAYSFAATGHENNFVFEFELHTTPLHRTEFWDLDPRFVFDKDDLDRHIHPDSVIVDID